LSIGTAFYCFCLKECQCFFRNCYQLGQECENLFSGTQARGDHIERSSLTLLEVFFMFSSLFYHDLTAIMDVDAGNEPTPTLPKGGSIDPATVDGVPRASLIVHCPFSIVH